MNSPKLNGWLRLYIAFFGLWVAFATLNFISNLPNRLDSSTIEQQSLRELISELEIIQKIKSPEMLLVASNKVCEAAYKEAQVNTNECLEFMINPGSFGSTYGMMMEVRIASSGVKDRAIEREKIEDDAFYSTLKETFPKFIVQLFVLPFIVLFFGYVFAWIRRGFHQTQ